MIAAKHDIEALLARLLSWGTALGCIVIGVGLVLSTSAIVNTGIVVFILLPVVRVGVMLAAFMRAGDRRFAIASGTVLVIVAASFVVAAAMAK